jgi:hypothetical protein
MMRSRSLYRRLAFVAMLLTIGAPASAARPDDNHVEGVALQMLSSQIEITHVYANGVRDDVDHRYVYPQMCVIYINNGPKAAVQLQFDFAAVSSDGKIGKAQAYDTIGKFAVGVLQKNGDYNCRTSLFAQVLDGQLREIRVFGRPEVYRLVAWINKVVYVDGTTWEAQPPTYVPSQERAL